VLHVDSATLLEKDSQGTGNFKGESVDSQLLLSEKSSVYGRHNKVESSRKVYERKHAQPLGAAETHMWAALSDSRRAYDLNVVSSNTGNSWESFQYLK